jgi:glycosyltransferase involved in cell wall biosynthesis
MKNLPKVLFIHHCRHSGGASRSLLNFLNSIKEDIDILLLIPKGQLEKTLKKENLNFLSILGLTQFDNSEVGHYKGKRWLILIREFSFLFASIFSVFKLRKYKFSAIHVNEMSLIIVAIFFKIFFSSPILMHVRTVQNQRKNLRSSIFSFFLNKYVDQIICIDQTVLRSLSIYNLKVPTEIIRNSHVIENSNYDLENSFKNKTTRVAMVSNFITYKGIFDFYEASLFLIKNKKLKNIEFHIFGDNYRNMESMKGRFFQFFGFQRNIKLDLIKRINQDSMKSHFLLKGHAENLDQVYKNIDILCFPSHLNAVGRPVIEASLYKIPSIVSLRDIEENDYIVNKITGIIVKEKDYLHLSKAIQELHENKEKRIEMGISAFTHFQKNFSHMMNSQKFLNILRLYC